MAVARLSQVLKDVRADALSQYIKELEDNQTSVAHLPIWQITAFVCMLSDSRRLPASRPDLGLAVVALEREVKISKRTWSQRYDNSKRTTS